MDPDIAKIYGNKLRVRVCGICRNGEDLLMVNHKGITETDFWAPPGGGLEFGESMHDRLKTEFKEETGLTITPGKFLFGCELIKAPLHTLELFFEATVESGRLRKGSDPEIQIISDVKFMSIAEIMQTPHEQLHGIFRVLKTPYDLSQLTGFYRI